MDHPSLTAIGQSASGSPHGAVAPTPGAAARLLAVAFGPRCMAEALAGLSQIRQHAECVELRLDAFEEPFDLSVLLPERGRLPVVVTLRPPDQGGRSSLSAEDRLRVLLQAAELGAEYVDLEYDAASPRALAALRGAGARVVLSRHDFSSMPADLADGWWPDLAARGADVVKVVGTARGARDCLQVFRAFARADRPTIAIAMGEAGLLTRVLAVREPWCLLTYAALDQATSTAPGQLSIQDMRQTYHADRLGPGTRVYGLLGPHAEPARLVEYNAWFVGDGVDGVCVPFLADVDPAGLIAAFRELPVSGWHVHGADSQAQVVAALDEVAPSGARASKVNAIVRRADGGLVGHWVESPREQYDIWRSLAV